VHIHNRGTQPCDVRVELIGPAGDWSLATPEHLTVPGAGVASGLLAMNDDAASALVGPIDPDRLGAAGHSLGGMTTLGLVANTCCHDPRFDAGVVLGRQVPFPEGEFFVRIDTPLLLAHGDADTSVPYADGALPSSMRPRPSSSSPSSAATTASPSPVRPRCPTPGWWQ